MADRIAAVAKLRNVASSMERANKPALLKAARAGQPIMRNAPGAPKGMVGKGRPDVKVKAFGDSVSLKWTPPGLTRIVNDPTKPHWIYPKKFVGTRGTGKKAQKGAALMGFFGVNAHSGTGGVKLRDGSIRHGVHHPGTKGKHFVERGKQAALPVIKKTYAQEALTAPLKEAMR